MIQLNKGRPTTLRLIDLPDVKVLTLNFF